MSEATPKYVEKELMSAPMRLWSKFVNYLQLDLPGGPKFIKQSWFINLQKGGTGLFVYWLMNKYNNHTPTAYAYLALHGSYGLAWLLKEAIFPDPNWQTKVTILGAVNAWAAVLGLYWVAPYLLISSGTQVSSQVICGSTGLYAIGLFLMIGSDCQKYFTLKIKRGLITNGFFSKIRHPNYLGEMMIYGSFAILANHKEPWYVLAWVWLGLFNKNISNKEESMSRYPEWKAYKKRSWKLVPLLF